MRINTSRFNKRLYITLLLTALVAGLIYAYFKISWHQATNTPWVVYARHDNRNNTKMSDLATCLKRINAEYQYDSVGNLLVRQGQISRITASCR